MHYYIDVQVGYIYSCVQFGEVDSMMAEFPILKGIEAVCVEDDEGMLTFVLDVLEPFDHRC